MLTFQVLHAYKLAVQWVKNGFETFEKGDSFIYSLGWPSSNPPFLRLPVQGCQVRRWASHRGHYPADGLTLHKRVDAAIITAGSTSTWMSASAATECSSSSSSSSSAATGPCSSLCDPWVATWRKP